MWSPGRAVALQNPAVAAAAAAAVAAAAVDLERWSSEVYTVAGVCLMRTSHSEQKTGVHTTQQQTEVGD